MDAKSTLGLVNNYGNSIPFGAHYSAKYLSYRAYVIRFLFYFFLSVTFLFNYIILALLFFYIALKLSDSSEICVFGSIYVYWFTCGFR